MNNFIEKYLIKDNSLECRICGWHPEIGDVVGIIHIISKNRVMVQNVNEYNGHKVKYSSLRRCGEKINE